jgi:glycosyltransferase involved in cell wall biosynthesis
MRTLVLSASEPPTPGRDLHGIYRRLAMFLDSIAEISEEIEVLHFARPGHWSLEKHPVELNEIQSSYWGRSVKSSVVPGSPFNSSVLGYALSVFSAAHQGRFSGFAGQSQMDAVRSSLRGAHQLIFVHRLGAMIPILRIGEELAPVVFDLDDIEHWVVLRAALQKPRSAREARRMLQVPAIMSAEYRAANLARKTFVCSNLDRSYLRSMRFGAGVTCVPNAIDVPPSVELHSRQPTILFLGSYQYSPNADAADRLISRIWPKIRAANSAARLVIAGSSPHLIKSFSRAPAGVEFPGIVKDLEQLYRETQVVCCPITQGGGTRLKLVEAAAYGRAIVSTRIGAEGLALQNEKDILIRDSDEAIADACIRLLADSVLCQQLGQEAHRAAIHNYDAKQVRALIKAHLLDATKRKTGT